MASFRDFLPFYGARPARGKQAQSIVADPKQSAKIYKISSMALGFTGGSGRANFEDAPYDFDRIIQAVDTDSYVKQAFAKYKELLWKEGWELVSENPDVVDYLHHRIDVMELTMRRSFQDVLVDVGDQIVKFGNAFLAKSRGDVSQFVNVTLTPITGKETISGFYVVPTETMQIMRDMNNRVLRYRQDVSSGGSSKSPEWPAEDMIHLTFDRKPGRVFGTPFIVSVLDDVIALRQIEEDIQNLVHRELFPLYKYKVGTPDDPADPDELENAAQELANLRTDGGLILPERHEVEVIGAENKALDASEYLRYFQERVVVGLGLAPHHLGIMNAGGNRSVTDRLDIALYDKIKTYQRYFADMFRILIFNELLMEGGFDPLGTPEDRCFFRFREIDVDTQVKKETHVLQKWTANAIDLPEVRMELGEDIEVDEQQLLLALQTRAKIAAADGNAQQPSTANDTPNTPQAAANAVSNKTRPQNQFGRRTSPNIRRSHKIDDQFLTELVDLIDGGENDIIEFYDD